MKLKNFFCCFLLLLCGVTVIWGQQITSLRITVVDQNSDTPLNVTARLKKRDNEVIQEIKNSGLTTLIFTKVGAGTYILEIESEGFKTQTQKIEINNGRNQITVKLEIADIAETVTVKRDEQEKNIDPREGAFTNFLARDEIENLPDDPDDLEKELKRRFGEDAVIQVDGFISSKAPPKAQIASIRISRSSFDAEYHQIGSTFISITSRAGGGKWSGSASYNFNNNIFNARSPLDLTRTSSQKGSFLAFLSGPIIKDKASLFLVAFGNNSYKTESIIARTPLGKVTNTLQTPLGAFSLSGKLSYNLNKFTTLNVDYQNSSSKAENLGVGGFNLPERAFDSKTRNHQLRLSESGYISKDFLNEVRFQYTNETAQINPASGKAAIIVLDAFSSGGAGNKGSSRRQYLSFADNLLFGIGESQALKIGGLFEFEKRNSKSANNENGTYIFSSLDDFMSSRASIFSQRSNPRAVNLSQAQLGAFVQDDVRLHKSLMLSLGLRYERQSNLSNANNFSPRIGFAWSPRKNGMTTFRGGAGVYYNWFETNNLATVLSQNVNQTGEIIIVNPNYQSLFESGKNQTLTKNFWQKSVGLKNPYIFITSFGVQQQLDKNIALSVLYKYQKGIYQFRSRDINAPLNSVRPDPDFGRIVQIESSGFFVQNSLNINLNGRLSRNLNYSFDYTLAKLDSDTNGIFGLPSDNYNLRLDRSASNLDQRHRFYSSIYWRIHKRLNLSTAFIANSPLPYTITTGFDGNGDTVFNDRPAGVKRNSERGTWQKQVDMTIGWTIGLIRLKAGQQNSPGTVVTTSDQTGSGDFGIDANHKYSIKLYSTAYNIFNQSNFTNFIGVQISPLFRQPAAVNSPRRIEFGLKFSF